MKLEFEQNVVSEDLFHELDFSSYLSRFDLELPLLPSVVLHPLSRERGMAHFERLSRLEQKIDEGKLPLDELMAQSRKIPSPDYMLSYFESGALEQFQLLTLGQFVSRELALQELEKEYPVDEASRESLLSIESSLKTHTTKGFSRLKPDDGEEQLYKDWQVIEKELKTKLSQYEREIQEQTGLKMIYPYPKEILAPSSEVLFRIQKCRLVSAYETSGVFRVDYRLSEAIENLDREKNLLEEELEELVAQKLQRVNEELEPFFLPFRLQVKKRKHRTLDYALIWVKQQYGLCLPSFHGACHLSQAVLPVLNRQQREKYVPLDLELRRGANVLHGANMTGKTTVLKTLFFHLTTIRMGLPVPAASVSMTFPEQVEIHLKTAGSIRRNLSSFGDELHFFTKKMGENAYILVDELFQTTDPVSGAKLSSIFLEEFSQKSCFFFCTSHYPEVLDVPGIRLFRMADVAIQLETDQDITVAEWLEKMPFRIEPIDPSQIGEALQTEEKPLLIALHFPIPESIKLKIRERMINGRYPRKSGAGRSSEEHGKGNCRRNTEIH